MDNASSADRSSPSAEPLASEGITARTAARILYGLCAWLQFALIGIGLIGLLLCRRPLSGRRRLARAGARLALRCAGMRLEVRGLCSLPSPCVVVANHESYLDGVVLAAVLPPRFSFVIKREMSSVPLAGLLLRRLGVEFVDRRGRTRGFADARRLLRQASRGQELAFFPEGTFSHEVGLLHFHIGAFAAAVRADLPVVPVAIRGTRHCLPPGSPWPRPGLIRVQVLASSGGGPSDASGDRASALRDAARAALLAELGEPDLARP